MLRENQKPNVFFVHANGKDRMDTLAKALKELGVPVDVIADIDVLRSSQVFERLFKVLGGDWATIKDKAPRPGLHIYRGM